MFSQDSNMQQTTFYNINIPVRACWVYSNSRVAFIPLFRFYSPSSFFFSIFFFVFLFQYATSSTSSLSSTPSIRHVYVNSPIFKCILYFRFLREFALAPTYRIQITERHIWSKYKRIVETKKKHTKHI